MKSKKLISLAIFLVFTGLVLAEFHARWMGTTSSETHKIRYMSKAKVHAGQAKEKPVDYLKLIEAAGKIRH